MRCFKERATKILENAKYQPINILVWGPGNPGVSADNDKILAYQKRIQIKEVLRKNFPRAEVYFSEDREMISISEGISGQLRKEALQARAAALIIMLDISRGADLELDYFVPNFPWFRDKVHVFLPEEYVPPKGLVKEVYNFLKPEQVEGFSKKEFNTCYVATFKAVRAAHTIALANFLKE